MKKPVYAICEQQRHRRRSAVRCLDSITPLVSLSEISSLYLASVAAQASLSPPWSQTLKTGFLVHGSFNMLSKVLMLAFWSLKYWKRQSRGRKSLILDEFHLPSARDWTEAITVVYVSLPLVYPEHANVWLVEQKLLFLVIKFVCSCLVTVDTWYRNVPKFLDRQVWVNSVDPDQTPPFAIPSAYFGLWMHYSTVKLPCSNFRTIFLGCLNI